MTKPIETDLTLLPNGTEGKIIKFTKTVNTDKVYQMRHYDMQSCKVRVEAYPKQNGVTLWDKKVEKVYDLKEGV